MLRAYGMIICYLLDTQDWRIQICPGLSPTGSTVYGQPAKLGSTLCADYSVCHVTLDFGTGQRGCENQEQVVVVPSSG